MLIHRHPYDVYASGLHTTIVGLPISALQRYDIEALCRRTIDVYRVLLDSYFADRNLIPQGNLVEIGFEDIEGALDAHCLRLHHSRLRRRRAGITAYVATLRDYQKNRFTELSPEIKSQIARDWPRYFEEWGYEP